MKSALSSSFRIVLGLVFLIPFGFAFSAKAANLIGTTERVSVSSTGVEGNGGSYIPSISADGRYIAFVSSASNLVIGDINTFSDVFVRDMQNNTTELISVSSDGVQGNNHSGWTVSISADGRYVAFVSEATNLVGVEQYHGVFVRDRQTNTTTLVSVSSSGDPANGGCWTSEISPDGRYVAFTSSATNLASNDTKVGWDVYVHDRQSGNTELVPVFIDGVNQNMRSDYPSWSGDGRFLAFESGDSNLVVGDTNGSVDVFVRDMQSGTIELVSFANNGEQGNGDSYWPLLSFDGRFITFDSYATNLVDEDTNSYGDTFLRDRMRDTTELVSINSNGEQGNDNSSDMDISADGRYIAFISKASNFVVGDTNGTYDLFIRDRQNDTIDPISISSSGVMGNGDSSSMASMSANGRFIAFDSMASNLVEGDINGFSDIFLHDRCPGETCETKNVYLPVIIR